MIHLGKKFISPMLSLFLVSAGAGIFTTAQSVWLHNQHYSTFVIGTVVSFYYLGFIYSAFSSGKLIFRVSHIRAYSFFASFLCSLMIFQGLYKNPYLWIPLRFLSGFCSAGLFIVIESWLLCESKKKERGSVLALYMVFYYAALALSQFLLNFGVADILRLFVMSALFSSLSIIPLAISTVPQPTIDEPTILNLAKLFNDSPSGVTGCFISGLIIGPIYGLMPIYFAELYTSASQIALLMFVVIAGGLFFQIPLGKLSDHIERRKVLFLLFLVFLATTILLYLNASSFYIYSAVCFIFGGAAFAIYPISMSHACDVLDVSDMVPAAQGLVLANSVGLVIGPLLVSGLISVSSAYLGLTVYFVIIGLVMSLFFLWRHIVGVTVIAEDQVDFIPVPRATPVITEIDPRVE